MLNLNKNIYALAFGAHPDDIELCASATLLKIMNEGKLVAACDLTKGEIGTRGSVLIRAKEAKAASSFMGYKERITLNLGDGKLDYNQKNLREVIKILRYFRPIVVFANPPKERHPDHEKASRLVSDAFFYAGLTKISTTYKGKKQTAYRPFHLVYYIHDRYTQPDFIVDVSDTFNASRKAVLAFKSQFYTAQSNEPNTYISRPEFLESLEARARILGEAIGSKYGEGFLLNQTLHINHFSNSFCGSRD